MYVQMIVCIAIYNSLHCHIQFPIIYHTHTQKKKGISFVFNLSFSVSKKRREPIWKKIIGWDIETRSWFSSKTVFFFFFLASSVLNFFLFFFFFFFLFYSSKVLELLRFRKSLYMPTVNNCNKYVLSNF